MLKDFKMDSFHRQSTVFHSAQTIKYSSQFSYNFIINLSGQFYAIITIYLQQAMFSVKFIYGAHPDVTFNIIFEKIQAGMTESDIFNDSDSDSERLR